MPLNKTFKQLNNSLFLIYGGVLVLLLGIYLEQGLVNQITNLGGCYSTHKITARVSDSEATSKPNCYFQLEDLPKIGRYFQTKQYIALTQTKMTVTGKFHKTQAEVIGTTELYPQFNSVLFKQGNFFIGEAVNNSASVAIIDDTLAQDIFGSEQVVGKIIELHLNKLKIIGVKKTADSIVHHLCNNRLGRIYIPLTRLRKIRPEVKINYIQIKTNNDGSTIGHNENQLILALKGLGKDQDSYTFIDYNIETRLLAQKPQITLFLIGLVIIIGLLKNAGRKIIYTFQYLRSCLQTEYLITIFQKNAVFLRSVLLFALFASLGIVFVAKISAFSLYIAPEYIPNELIDITFYKNLFKDKVREDVNRLGSPIPYEELIFTTTRWLSNLIFTVSNIFGWLLFLGGLILRKHQSFTWYEFYNYSLFLFISTISCILLTIGLGLSFQFEYKYILLFLLVFASRLNCFYDDSEINKNLKRGV